MLLLSVMSYRGRREGDMKTTASPSLRSDQVQLSTTAEPLGTRGGRLDTRESLPRSTPRPPPRPRPGGNPVNRRQGLTRATFARTNTPHTCTGPCAPQPRGRSQALSLTDSRPQSGSSRNPADARSKILAPEPQPTTLSQDRGLRHRCEQDPASSSMLS